MENPNNPTGQLQWRRSGEGHLELYVSEPLSFEWRKYDRSSWVRPRWCDRVQGVQGVLRLA
jgi:hypothetical protein